MSTAANATIALNINFTDPSAVIITATGTNSLVTDTGNLSANGFQLLGALPNNSTSIGDIGPSITSTLRPAGTGTDTADTVNQAYTDNVQFGGVTALNLYHNPTSGFWAVTTTESAFVGTAIVDLSNAAIGELPSVGDSGNVVIGYDVVSGTIGTWNAVPEPSSYTALLGLAALGFVAARRNKMTSNS